MENLWRTHGHTENPHPHGEPMVQWSTRSPMENPWPHRTPTALRCAHTPWSTHSPQPALGPCMALDFGCRKGEGCPLLQVGVAPCFGPHVSIPHGAPQAPRGPRGGVTVTQMSLLWVRGGGGGGMQLLGGGGGVPWAQSSRVQPFAVPVVPEMSRERRGYRSGYIGVCVYTSVLDHFKK